ncbi:MAG: hypothetical protein ACI4EF_07105 [Coprococcus sp.]
MEKIKEFLNAEELPGIVNTPYYMSCGTISQDHNSAIKVSDDVVELLTPLEFVLWNLCKFYPETKHTLARTAAANCSCDYGDAEVALYNLVRRKLVYCEEARNETIAAMYFMADFKINAPKVGLKQRIRICKDAYQKYGFGNKFKNCCRINLINTWFMNISEREMLNYLRTHDRLDDYIFSEKAIKRASTNRTYMEDRLTHNSEVFMNLLHKLLITTY